MYAPDGSRTYQELQAAQIDLTDALATCQQKGYLWAKAEAEYYSAKARVVYRLKESGMAATLIQMVVKGDDDVKGFLEAFHRAEVEYGNAKEAVNCIKRDVDILREQLTREWNYMGRNNGEY